MSQSAKAFAIAQKLFQTSSPSPVGFQSGAKVLRRKLAGDKISRYYPEPIEPHVRKFFPDYQTVEQTRRLTKLAQLRRRGKGPPPKGSGKRSKKK
ncbi:hypothetical protein TrRE_jg12353 [Triparma retinervis]|uniref:Small ribosomal subunit protein mS33 n=1 Tax=Triparma retinervis TaxID=2557542 RepID=A0A9W7E064_9STRA|nr:hypothetical protein TrRE_jg12353 [Triparma retinervis]